MSGSVPVNKEMPLTIHMARAWIRRMWVLLKGCGNAWRIGLLPLRALGLSYMKSECYKISRHFFMSLFKIASKSHRLGVCFLRIACSCSFVR